MTLSFNRVILLTRFFGGDVTFGFGTLIDSKFSDSKKSIEFEGEVYFNDIFDQIDKFHID